MLSSSITLSCFLAKSYNFTLSSNIPLDSESSATNSMIRWVLVPWNLKYKVEKIIGRGSGFVAVEIPFTPRAKRVLELSLEEARQLGHNYIGTEHLLLGLIREGEGVAARVGSSSEPFVEAGASSRGAPRRRGRGSPGPHRCRRTGRDLICWRGTRGWRRGTRSRLASASPSLPKACQCLQGQRRGTAAARLVTVATAAVVRRPT